MICKNQNIKSVLPKIIIAILLVAVAILIFLNIGKQKNEIEDNIIQFPCVLENETILLENLFQYDGINPDFGNKEGTDIAGITVENISETYLDKAIINVQIGDGTILNFTITNLPPGKKAITFSDENISIPEDVVVIDLTSKMTWLDTDDQLIEQVDIYVEGTNVTLKNNTGEDISELVMYCRSPLGAEYFGGISYKYTIKDFIANETININAEDCVIGMAEVVRLVKN